MDELPPAGSAASAVDLSDGPMSNLQALLLDSVVCVKVEFKITTQEVICVNASLCFWKRFLRAGEVVVLLDFI